MPSWILNVYNKDGSVLVGSGQLDQTYKVTDTGIIDVNGGSYMNVAFSNSNVIGYSDNPNSTVPDYHIGSTNFGFMAVGTYNIYEVEGDKYSITTSISNITINCKDKTMEKDLQISFNASAKPSVYITTVFTSMQHNGMNFGNYTTDIAEAQNLNQMGTINVGEITHISFAFVSPALVNASGYSIFCSLDNYETPVFEYVLNTSTSYETEIILEESVYFIIYVNNKI